MNTLTEAHLRNRLRDFVPLFLLLHAILWGILREFHRSIDLRHHLDLGIKGPWLLKWAAQTFLSIEMLQAFSAQVEIRVVDRAVARLRNKVPWTSTREI